MKNEDKPNFPMDKNDEIQSSSKKRKEHPVDMLANKTKTELLAEAHSALPHSDDVQRHLTVCMRCAILEEEIDNLQEHLKVALLPMSYGPHGSRTLPRSERWI
jgi:hypothetical protein